MFNQPKAAAPAPGPPPRATKPRAFKWKTSGEAEEASSGNKTISVADVPPPALTPTPATAESSASAHTVPEQQPAALTDKPGPPNRTASTTSSSGAPLEAVSSRASVVSAEDSVKHKGFSAEDAKQTAGSLKERIALLSGLKVDKPDAPGRAPKPWRKKTQEPEEVEEQQKSAVEATSESTDAPAGQTPLTEDPSQAEAGETTKFQDETEIPTTSSVVSSAKAADSVAPAHDTATSPTDSHGIALPAMPTRARGPQRKARSGGAAAASASSPTIQSPTSEPPSSSAALVGASKEATPSVTDKDGSPARPEESTNLTLVVDVKKGEDGQQDSESAENKASESFADDTPPARAPPKRASTSLIAQGIPLPPASGAPEREDSIAEREGSATGPVEHEDEISKITSGIAHQSIDDEPTSESAPVPVASPVARPPAPPVLDMQAASQSSSIDSPEVASPKSASVNRRSMNRPPIPSAYSQDTPSPRSSFDNRSQRSSVVESNRGSLVMSPTEPDLVSAEPESMAGNEALGSPAVDRPKESLPPASTKPFSTEAASSMQSPKSPIRKDSMPIPQQKRQSGAPAVASEDSGTAPVRTASAKSQSPSTGAGADRDEGKETNIDAMRAYRPPQEEVDENKDDDDKDGGYEDPEVARRQALAKRMAAMGGMKLGMLPQMPSMVKRKTRTEPREEQPMEKAEAPLSPPPVPPPAVPPVESVQQEDRENSPARPPAQSTPSYKPPAGAFVLPMMGRPPIPPPAVPPPPAPEDEEEREDEIHEAEEDDEDEDRDEQQGYEEEAQAAGDDTVTQPMEETDPLTPLPPPPPVPAARPPPPPPNQSFIETDTDTDGGRSEKRASLASSAGMGSLSDFPAPPAGESHARTQSSASRYSMQDQSETLYEEPESHEDYDNRSEQTETVLPPRPARRAPTLDTSVDSTAASGGNPPSRRESMADPGSPARSTHSYSQRSLPETPVSPTGQGGNHQERFGALSPTTSQSSRRSSAILSGQQQGAPAPAPGLNNEYLTYIAHSSSKTKSRDVDGPLAHTLNDIAFTYRNDPAGFGAPIYRVVNSGIKGQSPELEIHGRIDAGCVFFAWDAKFDRGLGRSSLKVGSAEVPHVGIVAEAVKDIKKAKVKVVELVQGRHNVETYKLDDLKSGTVELRRLP